MNPKRSMTPADKLRLKQKLEALHPERRAKQGTTDWLGRTGLPSEIENELVPYLRREFGESAEDEDAVLEHDLCYLGTFADEDSDTVHYWRIENRGDSKYAYVRVYAHEMLTGWCGSDPSVPRKRGPGRRGSV